MSMAQAFLHEFEQESKTTRKFLEETPEAKLTWRPHEKSMTAGQLAFHIASVPAAIIEAAQQREIPAPDFNKPFPQPQTKAEIMDAFEKSMSAVKRLLPAMSDAALQETWCFIKDGKRMMEMPRAALIRAIMLNHIYHHRGQYGVYLRLMGAKVPSSYGPSGDESPM